MLDLVAAQWDASIVRSWLDFFVPWWESFSKVFVGEDLAIQVACVVGVSLLAFILSLGLKPLFKRLTEAIEERDDWIEEVVDWLSANLFRFLLVALLWSTSLYFDSYNIERAARIDSALEIIESSKSVELRQTPAKEAVAVKNYILLRAVASVATLFLVLGALPARIKKQAYFKMLFFVLSVVLILNLLGIWAMIRDGLNEFRLLPVSESRETQVTVLTLLKGVIATLILVPLTGWVLGLTVSRVKGAKNLSPALQVMMVKFVKVIIVVGVGMFVLSSIGVNLSSLAVLGGAVGLGLGFGFQKVVSNLISGVILLGDKSIKPGDVIEVDETYGWINTLGARYTSVITRDGTEHLIPNEMMITEKVVNWSFSDDKVRVRIGFGVSYTSDIHKAMELALQAASEDPRILKNPAAAVRLTEYGDNSVNFELRVWILDPTDGLGNIRSAFYVRIWDLFKENDIEFPFPQRDLHLKEMPPLEVRMKREE